MDILIIDITCREMKNFDQEIFCLVISFLKGKHFLSRLKNTLSCPSGLHLKYCLPNLPHRMDHYELEHVFGHDIIHGPFRIDVSCVPTCNPHG